MQSSTLALLPWLNLKQSVELGEFTFAPVFNDQGHLHPALDEIRSKLLEFLKFFQDQNGQRTNRAVFAFRTGSSWELSSEGMQEAVRCSVLLMLACFSMNEYYAGRPYVNATAFQVFQCWPAELAAFKQYRRDGLVPHSGLTSDMFHFSLPTQCIGLSPPPVDEKLVHGLSKALENQQSATLEKIEVALPFFELANRDDPATDLGTQAILMIAAYEHLMKADAFPLSEALAAVLKPYKNGKTVKDARGNGRPVWCDPEHDEELSKAPVHQGWIYEFHKLRSLFVHPSKGKAASDWGWSTFEHLLMATFLFPLVAKLLLKEEDLYSLTPEDIGSLRAVDQLLLAKAWNADDDDLGWQPILKKSRLVANFDELLSGSNL